MHLIDRPTLSVIVALMWSLGLLATFSIWRINRQLPGPAWWLAGSAFFVLGFVFSIPTAAAFGESISLLNWSSGMGFAVNNAASLLGMLCMLEGILRFRQLGSLSRLWLVLPPVFIVGSFLLRDLASYRYMFLDAGLVIMLTAGAIAFVWRITPYERLVHGSAAALMLLPAAAFAGRFWLAVQTRDNAALLAHDYQKVLFLGLIVFTVGWNYSASLACYLKATRDLVRSAYEDILTQLPNRRHFDDVLQNEFAHSKRTGVGFAVCMIDLDRFKLVNDVYGHETGDAVLVELAQRLRHGKGMRASDFAARVGGDEFVVLAHDVGENTPHEAVLQRLREALNGPATLRGHAIDISVSIGIALWPGDGLDGAQLLHEADMRMYADKQAHKAARA